MFDSSISIIGFGIYIIFLIIGLFMVPLGFPGTWVIVIDALVYSLASDFQIGRSDLKVVVIVAVMATLAEVIEFCVGIFAGKKLNVSNGAIVCSIIGGFLGAVITVPIVMVGSLFGLLLGTFLGAFIYELIASRQFMNSIKSALGAFFSRVTSMFVKTLVAFAMVVYLLMMTF